MQDAQKTPKTPKEIHDGWQSSGVFTAKNGENKPKYYCLDMFPYPSAQGLHVGHPEGYTATDIVSRYKRMQGMNVLHPMGWDAFGLPAENYAIKTGVDPDTSTHANINNFRRQIQDLGFSYDWSREVDTSSPEYYRWTQWMFAQMYKNGLAYKKKARVNWCNSCQTVLANEQVIDGMCERSKDPVVQKELEQWFFKVTAYAERLLNDLDTIDWPEPIKLMQRNWIGRSEGVTYTQKVKDVDVTLEAFDSVPQTFMAQTFAVIAPEHPLLNTLIAGTEHEGDVKQFVEDFKVRKVKDKFDIGNEVEGIFTGRYLDNPFGTGDLPIWVATFVVADYGSGFVNCSACDERDFVFAKKYGIPLRPVMFPADPVEAEKVRNLEYCYHHDAEGILASPEQFAGRKWGEAREEIIDFIVAQGWGRRTVNYKIRDWLISRQRYWGAPIPVVYDPEGKPHLVEDKYLPLKLPTDVDFRPKGTSPLGSSKTYAALAEELYGKGWHFEVDTMDTFVCSSWYYLRYCDPNNTKEFAAQELLKQWLPVDMYVGGAEHAVLHLLYARFFHKALQDFGFIPKEVGSEPFKALRNQGMILGEDHQKMSKSKGNVINPDDIVSQYGADTLRMYEMFMGPFDEVKPWSTGSIKGIQRFLDRVSRIEPYASKEEKIEAGSVTALRAGEYLKERQSTRADAYTKDIEISLNKTIKKVKEDIEGFKFNTAISQLMVFVNEVVDKGIDINQLEKLILILSPFAPYTAENVWSKLRHTDLAAEQKWPDFNPELVQDETVTVAVQVNGKTRGTVVAAATATQEQVMALAQADEKISKHMSGKNIAKVIYVPGRILNIIAK